LIIARTLFHWTRTTLDTWHIMKTNIYPWSVGSWQVFHIVGLCVFSHQSADYSIVVAHLTSNSFEGHPCCMHYYYMVFSTTWLEFKDMAQHPLVRREPVSASCNRRPDDAMPCRYDQILPVVCRILVSLSHCWSVCVFSPVGWLQHSGAPSDVQ
jgi:hypothetical protein